MSLLVVSLLLAMLATYVICGIPFGLLIGKRAGTDPRQVGSKNIGATNVTREINYWAGALTCILDMLKGFICVFLGVRLVALVTGTDVSYYLPQTPGFPHLAWVSAFLYLAAVCGHVFSPYLRFRGGKGIAVGFGAALGFSWPLALGLLVVWALGTFPSRYVSVGSIISAISLPFLAFFIYYPPTISFEIPLILNAIIVVWAHRANLKRLREGKEQPFHLKKTDAPLHFTEDPVITDELEMKQAARRYRHKTQNRDGLPDQGTSVFFGSEPEVARHIEKHLARDEAADEQAKQAEENVEENKKPLEY